MKTFKLLVALAVLSAAPSKAQPIFGEAQLSHNNSYVTSAQITNLSTTQGYVIAGYSPITSGSAADFVIDHLDDAFTYTNSDDFSREYRIFDKSATSSNCTPTGRTYNCGGVDVVETNAFSNARYALAGVYNRGVFFVLLDATGAPTTRQFRWELPGTISSLNRPRIRETSTPGEYFICGYANSYSYAMRVDANGTSVNSVWAKMYQNTGGIVARDLIESPYNNQDELIIVGRIDVPGAGTAADAFFMSVDENTGVVNYLSHYDKQFTGDDWWSCIELATDPSAPGFIVGGRSIHPITSAGPPSYHYSQWMAKLDGNGGIYWSSLIWPQGLSAGTLSGSEICDVIERVNPNPNAVSPYEYYGVAGNYETPLLGPYDNLTVYKLDQGGGDLSFNPDQFHYLQGASAFLNSSIYDDAQITQLQTGGTNDGFQVYGIDFTNTSHYFAKAYFNGVDGCEEQANISRVLSGPTYVNSISINDANLNFACQSAFSLQSTAITTAINQNCGFSSNPSGGSNARQTATGISKNGKTGAEIYPNPVSNKAFVSYPPDAAVKIEVFNTMGQKMNVPVRGVEEGKAELDFAGSGLSNGIYFIHLTAGQETSQTKVLYTKE